MKKKHSRFPAGAKLEISLLSEDRPQGEHSTDTSLLRIANASAHSTLGCARRLSTLYVGLGRL